MKWNSKIITLYHWISLDLQLDSEPERLSWLVNNIPGTSDSYEDTDKFSKFWRLEHMNISNTNILVSSDISYDKGESIFLFLWCLIWYGFWNWIQNYKLTNKYKIFQYNMTQSQRDLYSHERERQDHGRVNLNLYGNKFYNPKVHKLYMYLCIISKFLDGSTFQKQGKGWINFKFLDLS